MLAWTCHSRALVIYNNLLCLVCACRFERVSYVHSVLHDEMLMVNGVIGAIFEMPLGNRLYYFAHNMENSDVTVLRGDVYLLINFRFTYFKCPWNIFYIYLEDRDTRIMSAGIKPEEKWKRIMLENIVSLCYLRNILLLHLYILLTEVKRYFLTLHCLRLLLNEKIILYLLRRFPFAQCIEVKIFLLDVKSNFVLYMGFQITI